MKIPTDDVKSWEQLQLSSSGAYEITLRIGVMAYDDHCQFELEITDAASGELIALQSAPHRPLCELNDELMVWLSLASEAALRLAEPF